MKLAITWLGSSVPSCSLSAPTVIAQHRTLRSSKMKRFFTFAAVAALAAGMSTIAWSQSSTSSTNPQARPRPNQLHRHSMGYNAFNDSRIRRQLNLSQDQIRQLRALNNSWRQQLRRFGRGGNNVNSADPSQWNQMWQQYATTINDVLTPQQQQTWSQLIGQSYTFSPNTMLGPTGTSATPTNSNSRAGMASAGQTSTNDATEPKFRATAITRIGPDNLQVNNQANGGGGSSAVGTALVIGEPVGFNQPGETQVQQGGGSSLFGTLLLNAGGQP
jgi:Spy/CpxP family protein refolding chaperone